MKNVILLLKVYPTKPEVTSKLVAQITTSNGILDKELVTIQYSHIPKQTILVTSESKVVKLDIATKGKILVILWGWRRSE